VVDLDAQCSASNWLAVDHAGEGLYAALTGESDLLDLIQATGVPGVAAVPSSPWVAGVEKALAGEIGAETTLRRALTALNSKLAERAKTYEPHWETVTTGEFVRYGTGDPERVWAARYAEAEGDEKRRMTEEKHRRETEAARARVYDFAILDCPPAMGTLLVNALAAAHEVIIPVEAHFMTVVGLSQLLETVRLAKDRLNPGLDVAGILVCRMDRRTRHGQEVLDNLRREYGELVFETVIRENVRLAECPRHHRPVTEYAPRSPGAEDYRALAGELLARQV